tara:strand:- start:9378 stop:9587 length:210 start_codon:yes stop_codon:yes gene_type:complete
LIGVDRRIFNLLESSEPDLKERFRFLIRSEALSHDKLRKLKSELKQARADNMELFKKIATKEQENESIQ